jgi:hypothetical protein
VWVVFLACVGTLTPSGFLSAQQTPPAAEQPAKPEKPKTQAKQATAEQVAEGTIFVYGSREGMAQIRKSGVERGRITRAIADGKTEEATYERRFIRGASVDKDRTRFDQKMPTTEYSLVFSAGQVWGVINEARFMPKQETTQEFLMPQLHGLDTLLRYKENGSTLNLIGKEQQKGLDLYVLDVTDREQRRTRFYISAKSLRVLWLQFEQRPESGGDPVKYERKFHDYHVAQGTLVPYRTVLLKNGTQVEETRILTITFGPKVDEALFHNPDIPASTTASKP